MTLFLVFCLISLVFVFVAALCGRDALIGLSITYVLLGNIVVGKLFPLFGLIASASIPMFVMIYILSNIINQYYGKDAASKTVWYAFGASIMAMALGFCVMHLDSGTTPAMDQAMNTIFGFLPRVVIGSLVAFIVSLNLNVRLYAFLKNRLPTRFVALPGFIASPIAIIVDTLLFTSIAFGITHESFADLCITNIVLRILFVIAANPIMSAVDFFYKKERFPILRNGFGSER